MQVGRYRVIRELGAGGMGKVHLAQAPNGQVVVLKRPLRADPDLAARMVDEARAGARVTHANLVDTLDLFEDRGGPVLVVAYVHGASLKEIREFGPLTVAAACRVGRQVAGALAAIHGVTDAAGQQVKMLHRDVTPSNVLLGTDGDSRLIDLGISRSKDSRADPTEKGFLRGKFRYLAPELFKARPYSRASDLWGLGMIVLEAALGRQVLNRSQPEVVAKLVTGRLLDDVAPSELDPGLRRALAWLLEPDSDRRLDDATEASAMFATLEREHGEERGLYDAAMLSQHVATARDTEDPWRGDSSAPTRTDIVRSDDASVHSAETALLGPKADRALPIVRGADTEKLAVVRGAPTASSIGSAASRIGTYISQLRALEVDPLAPRDEPGTY